MQPISSRKYFIIIFSLEKVLGVIKSLMLCFFAAHDMLFNQVNEVNIIFASILTKNGNIFCPATFAHSAHRHKP